MTTETISIDQEGSDDGGVSRASPEAPRDRSDRPRGEERVEDLPHPDQKIQTFKERAVHPLRRQHFRELKALNNVSLEVRKGEFFGIVGRNGSGKSTC